MKKTLFILSLLILAIIPAKAIKKIEANPINIAFILAQETDTAKIASICKYYGYELQQPKDGYTVYEHANSSIIRYSFKDATEEQPYPKVEVKSKLNTKEIDFSLTDLEFKKDGSGYIRKRNQYARTIINCKHTSGGFYIFHQNVIPRP